MASDVESDCDEHLSLDELRSWKVTELKSWLTEHGLKKSGVKKILVNRVYRALTNCVDSDCSDSSEDEVEDFVKFESISHPWIITDSSHIPDLCTKDVDNYFHYRKNPVTGCRSNFDRQMKKAKRLCNEGFVRDIEYNAVNDDASYCYFRSKCLPSMRTVVQVGNSGSTSKFYSLHVCISKKSGYIIEASCNCKAGEAGLCAHVGALLYTLSKTKNSCTSNQCQWDRPRPLLRKPSPKRIFDIKFSKTEKDDHVDKLKVKPYAGVYRAGPCQDDCGFLDDILEGLKDDFPQAVLYQTLRAEHANIDNFLDIYIPNFCYSDKTDIVSEDCTDVFVSFLDNLSVSPDICENLEKGTRGQHMNQNWTDGRSCLITASEMGAVCKRKKSEPDNLLKRICGYVKVSEAIKPLRHGIINEPVAVDKYMELHLQRCKDVMFESRGLLVNPKYPYLGASVDGVVICSECGAGLVEAKCPYGSDKVSVPWRNMKPNECCKDSNFFCKERNGKLYLNEDHNYMYQVQGQMAIYEVDWVDFVVWTKKGISIERITFSEKFWKGEEGMLPKLKKFYLKGIVPELFTRRVKRGKSLY